MQPSNERAGLHLIWPGPGSAFLLNRLNAFVRKQYGSVDDSFQIARNLEEQTRMVMLQNNRMVPVDNEVWFAGDVKELSVAFLVRNKDQEMFPNMLLNASGLKDLEGPAVEELFDIVVDTMEHFSRTKLRLEASEAWTSRKLLIRARGAGNVFTRDFEKSQLGIFFYLLYLRDRFRDNPDVCVIISNLRPLIRQVKRLEGDLATLGRADFEKKHPSYKEEYDFLVDSLATVSVAEFRILTLYVVLTTSGPFLQVDSSQKTANLPEARVTNAFTALMKRCVGTKARYTIALLSMKQGMQGHANLVIIDRIKQTVERYEPNGYVAGPGLGRTPPGIFGAIAEKADDVLAQLAKKLGARYLPPSSFCPELGVQSIEQHFKKDTGYCVSWTILYGIERVESGLDADEIARNFFDILVERYALEGRTPAEKSAAVELLLREKIHAIFGEMDELYAELAEELDVQLAYEKGSLVYFE